MTKGTALALLIITAGLIFGLLILCVSTKPVELPDLDSADTACRHGWQYFTLDRNSVHGRSYTLDLGEDGQHIRCAR